MLAVFDFGWLLQRLRDFLVLGGEGKHVKGRSLLVRTGRDALQVAVLTAFHVI